MVIIIDADEVSKLKVPSHTSGFAGNTFHSTTITEKAVCVVIDQVKSWFVEYSSCVCLSNCQTNGITETLTKRASSDFDSRSIMSFGMTGGNAVYLLFEH